MPGKDRQRACPKCGSTAAVPIHYGLPAVPRSWCQAVQEGSIKPGGKTRTGASPDWYCKGCGHKGW